MVCDCFTEKFTIVLALSFLHNMLYVSSTFFQVEVKHNMTREQLQCCVTGTSLSPSPSRLLKQISNFWYIF